MYSMQGLPQSDTIGFGWLLVRGRSLVPSPPAMTTARTGLTFAFARDVGAGRGGTEGSVSRGVIDEYGTAPMDALMLGPLGRDSELALDGRRAQDEGAAPAAGGT